MQTLLIIVVSYLLLGLVSTSLIYYSIYKENPEGLKKRAESINLTTTGYILRSVLYATPIWVYLWYITIRNYMKNPLDRETIKANAEKKLALIDRLREIKVEMEKMTKIQEPTFEDMLKAKRLFDEFMSVKAQLQKEDY